MTSVPSTTISVWGTSSRCIQVVDCHCGGEPARVVVGGICQSIPGTTMYAKREYVMEHMDHLRKLLLQEPRGYPCQNANIIVPPTIVPAKLDGSSSEEPQESQQAEYGYIIMEQNKIYPAMSGHNTICVATALLETGMITMREPVTNFSLEAPAGIVQIRADCKHGKAERITFQNVPAFVGLRDIVVKVPELDISVRCDVCYGGMWYCIVDADQLDLELVPSCGKQICRYGEAIKVACREQFPVQHPELDYPGCDILVFRAPPTLGSGAHSKNAVVMSNGDLDWSRPETWTGMIDRSPCGTGTCAVMALLHARGELSIDQDFIHESIVGTQFVGRLIEETTVAGIPAVVPLVSGQAWITQFCQVVVHPTDPFPEGFTVGDIWS